MALSAVQGRITSCLCLAVRRSITSSSGKGDEAHKALAENQRLAIYPPFSSMSTAGRPARLTAFASVIWMSDSVRRSPSIGEIRMDHCGYGQSGIS